MLTTDQINDLHHLSGVERWPIRKIEQHLRIRWHTIKKYLEASAQTPAAGPASANWIHSNPPLPKLLEKDARASAAVVGQRLLTVLRREFTGQRYPWMTMRSKQ